MARRITLIGKPQCQLCDEMRSVIQSVCESHNLEFTELSVLDHPELAEKYWLDIPVVLVDENIVSRHYLKASDLEVALGVNL
jgi:hypothetical protein